MEFLNNGYSLGENILDTLLLVKCSRNSMGKL